MEAIESRFEAMMMCMHIRSRNSWIGLLGRFRQSLSRNLDLPNLRNEMKQDAKLHDVEGDA